MKVTAHGIVWYRRKVYDEARALMVDGDVLPATYDQWLKAAKAGEQQIHRAGGVPVRVDLEPQHFAAWCLALNVDPDAHARIRFAAEGARQGPRH